MQISICVSILNLTLKHHVKLLILMISVQCALYVIANGIYYNHITKFKKYMPTHTHTNIY